MGSKVNDRQTAANEGAQKSNVAHAKRFKTVDGRSVHQESLAVRYQKALQNKSKATFEEEDEPEQHLPEFQY